MKHQKRLVVGCLVAAAAGCAVGMLIAPAESEKFRKGVKDFFADLLVPSGETPGTSAGGSTETTTFSNHG